MTKIEMEAVFLGVTLFGLVWALLCVIAAICITSRRSDDTPQDDAETVYKFHPGQELRLAEIAGRLASLLPATYHAAQFIEGVDVEPYYDASSALMFDLELLKGAEVYTSDIVAVASGAGATKAEIQLLRRFGGAEFDCIANDAMSCLDDLTDWLVVEDVTW